MNLTRPLLALLFIAVIISSCKKATLIGNDLLPASDDINGVFTDTLTLVTKTVKEFPLKTSTNAKFPIGVMNDDVFGKTTASLYTQFQISGQVDLGAPATLFVDSLVLNLEYAGSYGKYDNPQTLTVYQLSQAMSRDSEYYSDKNFATHSQVVGVKRKFVPNLTQGIYENGDSLAPSLRIRLSDRLGQQLLEQSQGTNFASNDAFQQYFKGLYISSDSNDANAEGCVYISINSTADSRLTVFYHTTDTTGLKFSFPIGASSNSFSHYTHNYSGTPVNTALQSTDVNDSNIYVQSSAGVKSRITIPNLKNLGNILVNKAELEVFVPATSLDPDSVYTVPSRLICLLADSAGKNAISPDQISTNLNYGGAKTEVMIGGALCYKYTFSLAERLQDLVNGGVTDYGFFLVTYQSPEVSDRVICAGGNRSDDFKMKLNLIYTKLP